jgi:ribosomal protein S18 acetylase RimI-like enzyme
LRADPAFRQSVAVTGWKIEAGVGLTPAQYQEVVRLQGVCEAREGLDLKLELFPAHAKSSPDTFLAYCDDHLVGYCGVDFGREAEVCGMVDPGHRRRGIAGGLLEAALAAAGGGGRESVLVICEDASPVALEWMRRRGATLDQSELRMVLSLGSAPSSPTGSKTRLRPASGGDQAQLVRLLSAAFPGAESVIERHVAEQPGDEATLMAYEGQTLVGTTRLVATTGRTMIYGFVIDRPLRGQGHGRSMMTAVLDELRDRGVSEVGLEVEPGNIAAVRLYGGCGFQVVTTYRYMRVSV